jgi:hypothetical protein
MAIVVVVDLWHSLIWISSAYLCLQFYFSFKYFSAFFIVIHAYVELI